MSKVFSVAIVGAGRIAGLADEPRAEGLVRTHAQAYVRHPRFRLTAVVDPDAARREHFRSAWQIPADYASVEAMLADGAPEAVSICSVTNQHYPQLLQLLECGKTRAILSEKPVCERPEELRSLLDRQRSRPETLVLVNHSRRFDANHQRIAAQIRAGGFGKLISGRCDYYGGWLHNGTHLVDTLRMFVGELRIGHASVGAQGKPGDPCLDVRLFAGDAPIDVFGFDERHYQLFEIDLRFSEGRIVARNFGEQLIIEHVITNAIDERVLAPVEGSPSRAMDEPLLNAVDAMAGILCNERAADDSGATLEQAAETMKVLWQAVEQTSRK
jgi:predicted dehydrogenase